jgi:hypothetical protein
VARDDLAQANVEKPFAHRDGSVLGAPDRSSSGAGGRSRRDVASLIKAEAHLLGGVDRISGGVGEKALELD